MFARPPLVISVVLLLATSVDAGMLSVDEWRLTTAVNLLGPRDTDQTTTVSNPFNETRNAALSSSTSASSYNIAWDAVGNFDFHDGVNQAIEANLNGWSSSNGYVRFTPDIDSIMEVDAAYSYAFSTGERRAVLQIQIFEANDTNTLFYEAQEVSSINGDPLADTLTTQASVQLDASVQYILGFTLTIYSKTVDPSDLSTASGYLDATIRPIPEPAAAMLMLAGAPLITRRRRTR